MAAGKKAGVKMENRILLVDDEKDIVDLMEEVLQKEGFHAIQRPIPAKRPFIFARSFSQT